MYHYGTTNYKREKMPDGSVNVTRMPVATDLAELIIPLPILVWMLAFFLTCLCWTCEFMYTITVGEASIWTHFVFPFTPYLCLFCWVIYPLYRIIRA